MGIWDGYDPTKEGGVSIEVGEHKVKLVKCEPKLSTNQNEMLSMEFRTVDDHKFMYSIVEGEYFSQKINAFYDAFKIPRGNQEIGKWIGRTGTAFIDKQKPKKNEYGEVDPNQKLYMEIKYFIKPTAPASPYAGTQSAVGTPAPQSQRQAAPAPRQNAPAARQPAYQSDPALDAAANAGWDDGFQDDVPYAGGRNVSRDPVPQDIF